MLLKKTINFVQEVGTIMYVGGILSHIVIGVILGHPDGETAHHVYVYKEMSAYILILPGLALKMFSDLVLFFQFDVKPIWFKIKLVMIAFLATNAFVFLGPMMPELVELAKASPPDGPVSQAFLEKEHTEQLVGMSNIIPLIAEMVLGSFKPRLFKERPRNETAG